MFKGGVLLERLEIDEEQDVQVWRMLLKPSGEGQTGQILSEVTWRLSE